MLKMFAKKKWGAKIILKVGRGGKVMYPLAMAPTMPLLLCTGSISLSKHVTHYGRRSDFPYYNMTTPYLPPRDALNSSVGLSPGNH